MSSEIVLPVDAGAERAVLGASLTDNGALLAVIDRLTAADFHIPDHALCWGAIKDMVSEGSGCDFALLYSYLQRNAPMALPTAVALADELPDPGHLPHYAQRVLEASHLRREIRIGERLIRDATATGAKPHEVADTAAGDLLAIIDPDQRRKAQQASILVAEMVRSIETSAHERKGAVALSTGFPSLDQLLGGLWPQQLIILAARPGVGKTALAMNVAVNAAAAGGSVQFHSLEMGSEEVTQRLLASLSGVSLGRIRRRLVSSSTWTSEVDDLTRLRQAERTVGGWRLWVDDFPGLSVGDLRARVRERQMQGGVDLVVVDYLQLMSGGSKGQNRTEVVTAISRGLKLIAKEFRVPVLAVSQLVREGERTHSKATKTAVDGSKTPEPYRPMLYDLRDSGSLEQDADVVLFIARHTQELTKGDESDRGAELIVAKQRSGPLGSVPLLYDGPTTTFQEV